MVWLHPESIHACYVSPWTLTAILYVPAQSGVACSLSGIWTYCRPTSPSPLVVMQLTAPDP